MPENRSIFKTRVSMIERIKDPDDTNAWNEFYRLYWNIITGWAKMFGCNEALAKDVFQETVVSLLKNLPDFEYDLEKGCFRSYLKTIVSRKVKNAYRRDKRYFLDEKINEKLDIENFSPLHKITYKEYYEMDKIWIHSILGHALSIACSKVDKTTYRSFCLHVFEELPISEVAKQLKIPKDKVIYGHKRRFLEIMKREFGILLKQMADNEIKLNDLQRNSLFDKAFEDMLQDKHQIKETITCIGSPPDQFKQIDIVRRILSERELPVKEGAYLRYAPKVLENLDNISSKPNLSPPIIHINTDNIQADEWISLSDHLTIGRKWDNNIAIAEKFISSFHAEIKKTENNWIIIDNSSSNGILLNNRKVNKKAYIKNGDIIQISPYYPFIFYIKD